MWDNAAPMSYVPIMNGSLPGIRVAQVLAGSCGREAFNAIAVADLPQTAWVVFGAATWTLFGP